MIHQSIQPNASQSLMGKMANWRILDIRPWMPIMVYLVFELLKQFIRLKFFEGETSLYKAGVLIISYTLIFATIAIILLLHYVLYARYFTILGDHLAKIRRTMIVEVAATTGFIGACVFTLLYVLGRTHNNWALNLFGYFCFALPFLLDLALTPILLKQRLAMGDAVLREVRPNKFWLPAIALAAIMAHLALLPHISVRNWFLSDLTFLFVALYDFALARTIKRWMDKSPTHVGVGNG